MREPDEANDERRDDDWEFRSGPTRMEAREKEKDADDVRGAGGSSVGMWSGKP